MAPPRWTTQEQLEWLLSKKQEYLDHQKRHVLHKFWPPLYAEWFSKWPEATSTSELETDDGTQTQENGASHSQENGGSQAEKDGSHGKALEARHRRLRQWFANHKVDKARTVSRGTTLHLLASLPKVRGSRRYQPVKLYSKKYYPEGVRPGVKAEIEAMGGALTKADILDLVKRRTRQAFDGESEEVKAEITAQMEQLKLSEPGDVEDDAGLTLESIQTTLDEVPAAVDRFLGLLAQRTGWCFTLIGGGPHPTEGGIIRTLAFHQGTNLSGHDFSQSTTEFKHRIIRPYGKFLKSVYPDAVCTSHALPKKSKGKNTSPDCSDDDSASSPGTDVDADVDANSTIAAKSGASVQSTVSTSPAVPPATINADSSTRNPISPSDFDSLLTEAENELALGGFRPDHVPSQPDSEFTLTRELLSDSLNLFSRNLLPMPPNDDFDFHFNFDNMPPYEPPLPAGIAPSTTAPRESAPPVPVEPAPKDVMGDSAFPQNPLPSEDSIASSFPPAQPQPSTSVATSFPPAQPQPSTRLELEAATAFPRLEEPPVPVPSGTQSAAANVTSADNAGHPSETPPFPGAQGTAPASDQSTINVHPEAPQAGDHPALQTAPPKRKRRNHPDIIPIDHPKRIHVGPRNREPESVLKAAKPDGSKTGAPQNADKADSASKAAKPRGSKTRAPKNADKADSASKAAKPCRSRTRKVT